MLKWAEMCLKKLFFQVDPTLCFDKGPNELTALKGCESLVKSSYKALTFIKPINLFLILKISVSQTTCFNRG